MTRRIDIRIDLKMSLLGFFLLPMVLVSGRELTINNYIVKIDDNILKNVEPIGEPSVELDLTGLALENIDEVAFRNATNLTILNLTNNLLTDFPSESLNSLVNLKNVSVANNRIKNMPPGFVGLDNLESVDLSHNPLKSLNGLGNYGRGRCDFIIKESPIEEISHTYVTEDYRLSTLKTPFPLFLDMNAKCVNMDPKFWLQEAPHVNVTLADENIKCPVFGQRRPSSNGSNITAESGQFELCIENGTLQRLSILLEGFALSQNCKKLWSNGVELQLDHMGIVNFAKSWYRLGTTPIYSIYLTHNKIASLTTNLLNDLPESVKLVRLSGNKIERLESGIIQNQFLMELDLSMNGLREIQSNAFEKTNLTGLMLKKNNLTDITFVESLPLSLQELYLAENKISQVPANSFSKLKNLYYLNLSWNKITELGRQSLQGLSSLQRLLLSNNGLKKIESGAFRDLGELRELDLDSNSISTFEKSVFSDLKELIFLYLNNNNLQKVTKDTFKGLPDNLRELQLVDNEIESLEKDSFVKVPKYQLELGVNKISKIEKGAINIPSLINLYLYNNRLSEIKEEHFDLMNLQRLDLFANRLRKIEKGAFRKLKKLEHLGLSGNLITTVQKGSLFGIKLRAQIETLFMDLELIQGGAFLDE